MSELALLKKKINREREARKAAEQLLEDKSLELYLINKELEAHGEQVAEQKEKLQKKVEELQQTRSQLVQSEKMAAVGQLAAGIAHEINNPVGFISSNLGSLNEYLVDIQQVLTKQTECIGKLLVGSEPGNETVKELSELKQQVGLAFILSDIDQLLSDSIEGTHRVKNIIADLSEFSHADGPELAREDINQLIDKTINVAWNELKYKAEVEKEFGELPLVLCNGGKLAQAFLNLLVNAAQAIESRGVITLRSGQDGSMIWAEVEDTGSGIPDHMVSKIFDPFFTTKEVGKGTGLGLHMVQSVIDSHGGTVSVSSEVGKGTLFHLTLPVDGVFGSSG
jgi:two-component system NtrC family sensor kinase